MSCCPQSNRQVEATNKTILIALKKRLERAKGKWVDELPVALWAYRTTFRQPTGTTPFTLTYGIKVIILTEIGMPTTRTTVQSQRDNTKEQEMQPDWVDEIRGNAAIRMTSYQQRSIAYYSKKNSSAYFPY